MIKLKFKNRDDEIWFFKNIRNIEIALGIKIRYAECVSDLDLAEKEKEEKDDE